MQPTSSQPGTARQTVSATCQLPRAIAQLTHACNSVGTRNLGSGQRRCEVMFAASITIRVPLAYRPWVPARRQAILAIQPGRRASRVRIASSAAVPGRTLKSPSSPSRRYPETPNPRTHSSLAPYCGRSTNRQRHLTRGRGFRPRRRASRAHPPCRPSRQSRRRNRHLLPCPAAPWRAAAGNGRWP